MKLIHFSAILLILTLYLLLCLFCYLVLRNEGAETSFWDIFIFNFLAVTGNDYMYVDDPWTRVAGIFVLILGMVGLSSITGYVSSAFVARRLNLERGVKKMQNMKDHVILCGWKNDVKMLIQGILRKNKDMKPSDIILINNADDVKLQSLRDDGELRGLHVLRGDFTEEQTLLNANVKDAAKVLIIGENHDNLDEELVDSR
ncbi:MAG: NAD-binding protein, partial [Lachnospiraceae bacterium]|nr:NAD-binding protein [Lachnospiraceae bacterium]